MDKYYVSRHYTSSCLYRKVSKFYLKTEAESSLQNVVFCNVNRMVFLDKDRIIDNVQKCNICTNVPLSQTFNSY
jgi:hypothetical protein